MKNKTNLIQGIIYCAQGIILDAFALYAVIPTLGSLWLGDLYKNEKSVAIFTLIIWIGVSIGASIVLSIGKTKLLECFSDSSNAVPNTPTYSATTTASIFKDTNSTTIPTTTAAPVTPSNNEWKCPNCGKINQNYTGTCGCGQLKPDR